LARPKWTFEFGSRNVIKVGQKVASGPLYVNGPVLSTLFTVEPRA
jgi:hypothetical protein